MKKYIYFIFSLFLLVPVAIAKVDCDVQINNYFNKNYSYAGGASAAAELAIQRRCLHARNPIYSDAYEFEQKQKYLFGIDDNFLVRKKLIDYQEIAEVLAERGDIEKSSKYVDKFNDILVKRYDKILAAKILKHHVENGLISQAHQEELYEKLDEYLFKIGKCNPGICEGWGLISTVAGAFPKCAEDSCQINITYESLYFDLAKTTNNSPKATETIKKLLAKDFGTSKSNGEVKAPLLLALSYIDVEEFFNTAENFLEKAKGYNLNYNYQDAILFPLITELMIELGHGEKLLSYAKAPPYNIAGMEASLSLLSQPISEVIRGELRPNIEYFYEKTSACNTYRATFSQGMEKLQQSSPAQLSKNPELDLFLRRRMQNAYWTDGFGGTLEAKAGQNTCAPSKNLPEDINSFLVTSKIVKDFVREGFIDDVVLLPLFGFNKIKTVINGMKRAPNVLKISYYNDKAMEVATNTRRLEVQMDRNLRRLNEMADYKIAVGQDFVPYNIPHDGELHIVTNSKTKARRYKWGNDDYYDYKRKVRETTMDLEIPEQFYHNNYPENYNRMSKRARRALEKDIEYFSKNADSWMYNIGYENTKKLAKIMGVKWEDLKNLIADPQLIYILQTGNPTITNSIINRVERLYSKYHLKILKTNNTKFTVAYFPPGGKYNGIFDSQNIVLVEEVHLKQVNVKNLFLQSQKSGDKLNYLSRRDLFLPKNSGQTFEAYMDLLECTPVSPCIAILDSNGFYLRILNADGKKIIRVASHEYYLSEESYKYLLKRQFQQVKEFPRYHFHYYEIQGDRALNYHINVDLTDGANNIFSKSPDEIRKLLIPFQEVIGSPAIKVKYL